AEEYSLFISSLWLGKIVSPASVTTMLAQKDPNADGVGIGMYASKLTRDGVDWWDYNENGGGGRGGAQGIWMTFFNGYTAVFISNTAWGLGDKAAYQLMEESFSPALTPTLKIVKSALNKVNGEFTVTWTSQPGATYTIDRSTDLKSWTKLKTGYP